jgi:hypothetical protein
MSGADVVRALPCPCVKNMCLCDDLWELKLRVL